MPTLPLSYWSALVIAGALALYFGGRRFGAARSVSRLRDITPTGAFGYSLLVITLYQGIALYFGQGMNPGATFFRWAVHGVVGFGIAGYLFQQFGRHVGTRASKKLFRSMPVTAALGILLILIYAFVAIFADVIAPYGQAEIFKDANVLPGGNPEMGGNPAHFLGTDQIGRDILSRLIYGAQNTVGIAFVTTLLAFFIGISLGFLAATIGGVLDQILSRIVDMLMSIPQLIFALLLMTIATAWLGSQKSMVTLFMILIIAVLDSTRVFRLARAVGMNIVVMDFFEAAKLRGEKLSYLIFSEITPNAFAPLLAEFGLRFCFVFLTIASLSFLGIGIQPPLADWGTMVRDLSQFINFAVISPLTASLPLMAAGAIALLTVAVNFVVDWMLHRASGLKE
ncbi:MAG: ABC transporter permease [Candidatus Puniceispirillaceae bacterium]|jgi:peptide/nickel transport system permease protein